MAKTKRPLIAIAMGDSAGIAPELCLHAAEVCKIPEPTSVATLAEWTKASRLAVRLSGESAARKRGARP